MKKIIFAALSVLMILSLVGCGEHIDYTKNPELGAGAIPGAFNNWTNTTAWTTADDTSCVYTYNFTASAAEIEWKAITVAGDWNSGAYINAKVKPDGVPVKLEYDNKSGGGTNASLVGLIAGSSYELTVYSEDGAVYAKAKEIKLPLNLNDNRSFYIRGDMNGWGTGSLTEVSKTDEYNTYTFEFKAEATEVGFKLATADYATEYAGLPNITVGADFAKLTVKGDNNKITGLTVGNSYVITVRAGLDSVELKVSAK